MKQGGHLHLQLYYRGELILTLVMSTIIRLYIILKYRKYCKFPLVYIAADIGDFPCFTAFYFYDSYSYLAYFL